MSFSEALKFARSFVKFSNDVTFLSSISFIDLENNYISVKPGYWKLMINFIRRHYTIQPISFGKLCQIIKNIFMDRFLKVEANTLKKYMIGKIYKSFFNFSNLIYYTHSLLNNKVRFNSRLTKAAVLRKQYYFEEKAKRYIKFKFEHLKKLSLHEEQQDTSEITDQVDPIIEEINAQPHIESSTILTDDEILTYQTEKPLRTRPFAPAPWNYTSPYSSRLEIINRVDNPPQDFIQAYEVLTFLHLRHFNNSLAIDDLDIEETIEHISQNESFSTAIQPRLTQTYEPIFSGEYNQDQEEIITGFRTYINGNFSERHTWDRRDIDYNNINEQIQRVQSERSASEFSNLYERNQRHFGSYH